MGFDVKILVTIVAVRGRSFIDQDKIQSQSRKSEENTSNQNFWHNTDLPVGLESGVADDLTEMSRPVKDIIERWLITFSSRSNVPQHINFVEWWRERTLNNIFAYATGPTVSAIRTLDASRTRPP
jgi:hypothetical protein